jgi:hypothetical protein
LKISDYLFASKYPKEMVTERVKIANPKIRILSGSRNTSNPIVIMLIIRNIEIISKKKAITPINKTKLAILTIFSIFSFFTNQIMIFKCIIKNYLSPSVTSNIPISIDLLTLYP